MNYITIRQLKMHYNGLGKEGKPRGMVSLCSPATHQEVHSLELQLLEMSERFFAGEVLKHSFIRKRGI